MLIVLCPAMTTRHHVFCDPADGDESDSDSDSDIESCASSGNFVLRCIVNKPCGATAGKSSRSMVSTAPTCAPTEAPSVVSCSDVSDSEDEDDEEEEARLRHLYSDKGKDTKKPPVLVVEVMLDSSPKSDASVGSEAEPKRTRSPPKMFKLKKKKSTRKNGRNDDSTDESRDSGDGGVDTSGDTSNYEAKASIATDLKHRCAELPESVRNGKRRAMVRKKLRSAPELRHGKKKTHEPPPQHHLRAAHSPAQPHRHQSQEEAQEEKEGAQDGSRCGRGNDRRGPFLGTLRGSPGGRRRGVRDAAGHQEGRQAVPAEGRAEGLSGLRDLQGHPVASERRCGRVCVGSKQQQ